MLSMATLRALFKCNGSQHSSNHNTSNARPISNLPNETLPSNPPERANSQTNDGCTSPSILVGLPENNGDSLRHPLLNNSAKKIRRGFLSRLMHNSTNVVKQEEDLGNENACLLDTKLPKELVLR